jgi:RHH-type rel operon transcriptional repressor/antitoxin RelB
MERRLDDLARRTHRSKTFYIKAAIQAHLEDLEDNYLAEEIMARVRAGQEETIPLEAVLRDYGLEG